MHYVRPRPNHDISPIDEEDDLTAPAAPASRARPVPYDYVPEQVLRPEPDMSARAILPSQRVASRQAEHDRELDRDREASSSPQPSAHSNIPMMRRERRAQRDAEAAASRMRSQDGSRAVPLSRPRTTSRDGDRPRGQKNPRWDPMTGEVTTSDKGRPSQVKPVEYARGLGISTMASHTPTPGPPNTEKERERQSPRGGSRNGVPTGTVGGSKVSDTDPAATAFAANNRPGWRGASGRTAIVDPVKDNTEVAPLKIPPRSTKRGSPGPPSTEAAKPSDDGADRGVTGLLSPPISPETLTREQPHQAGQQQQQIGGGGSAGKSQGAAPTAASAAKASLASTLRRIMPIMPSSSSSVSSASPQNKKQGRFFSRDDSIPDPDPTQAQAQGVHGYPSPPLSGDSTVVSSPGGAGVVAGGAPRDGSAAGVAATPVNVDTLVRPKASGNQIHPSDANAANIANVNASSALASASAPPAHHPQQTSTNLQPARATDSHNVDVSGTWRLPSGSGSESGQATPTAIRRKEVGSAISLGPFPGLNTAGQSHHKPHESFSSSVYSRPDDDDAHRANHPHLALSQPPRQPPSTIRLNTKNLPNLPGANNDASSPYAQPPSRFSVTTYATSANTSSPRASLDADAPPLPTPPKDIVISGTSFLNNNKNSNQQQSPNTMNANNSSVLERRRPELRGGLNKWDESEAQEEPVKISLSKAWMTTAGANSAGIDAQNSPPRTRKDPPKGPRDLPKKSENKDNEKSVGSRGFGFGFLGPRSPAGGSDSNSNSSRPASIMSNMDKDLPPAPSQAPASATTTGDRINQLNSLLQDLANRRLNINRAIRQMTELMPQDNLMLPDEVRRKREVEKRKIEELNLKLADIGREEHDLGMKLHRAYKKLDQQTEYEPTTLWVRRATGS